MKIFISVLTIALMLTGIYQVEFADIDIKEDLDRITLQVYISFSTLCIITAIGDKQ